MERRIVGALIFVASPEFYVSSLFHWICFPFLPYCIVPFCAETIIAAVPPRILPLVYFF